MASGVQPSRPDAKLTASVARATKLRRRSDLICHSHRYCHETIWVVKDPLSLKYFKLPEPEYFILQRLDGESTPESIKEAFDREYAPQTLRFSDLEYFLGHLHQSGLVLSNGEGQGSTLIRRGRKSWWKKKLSVVTNSLARRRSGPIVGLAGTLLPVGVFEACSLDGCHSGRLCLAAGNGAVEDFFHEAARVSTVFWPSQLAASGFDGGLRKDPPRVGARP